MRYYRVSTLPILAADAADAKAQAAALMRLPGMESYLIAQELDDDEEADEVRRELADQEEERKQSWLARLKQDLLRVVPYFPDYSDPAVAQQS